MLKTHFWGRAFFEDGHLLGGPSVEDIPTPVGKPAPCLWVTVKAQVVKSEEE